MGFRMRKSINLGGGFRVNLSKSGIGYSWGVPGYRITKTAKGNLRRTYSVPGTGLSYVDETNNKKNTLNSNNFNQEVLHETTTIMEDIESADIKNYQPAEYQDFIQAINKIIKLNKVSTYLCATLLFAAYPLFLISGIIGIVLKIYIRGAGRINLDYELDQYYIDKHKNMINAWTTLSNSLGLWQIIQQGNVVNRKVNAGASSLVNRKPFKIVKDSPYYLKSETQIIQIKLLKETLIILPDKLLVIKGSKIGAISYDKLNFDVGDVRFIESEKVPNDAVVLDYTWEKVNKNGTPDKRYKGNRQLPICKYGIIGINSTSGLNIVLQCSNPNNTINFEELMLI